MYENQPKLIQLVVTIIDFHLFLLTFVDLYHTSIGWVLEMFVKWKKLVEARPGRKIKVLRIDIEWYTCGSFLQVYQNKRLKWHFAKRYTDVAEYMDHTLLVKSVIYLIQY